MYSETLFLIEFSQQTFRNKYNIFGNGPHRMRVLELVTTIAIWRCN